MTLTKTSVIGVRYGHFYSGGFQECTQQEYEALKMKGAGPPSLPAKWLHSSGPMREYDTASGFLEENFYADLDENRYLVKTGGHEYQVAKDFIVNNELMKVPSRGRPQGTPKP